MCSFQGAKKFDVIAGSLDALKRKSHRPLEAARFAQREARDFVAHIGNDRVRELWPHHDGGRVV
jgi:hypothetical protein